MNNKKILILLLAAFVAGSIWAVYNYQKSPQTIERTFMLEQIPENAQFDVIMKIPERSEKINASESFRFLKNVRFSIDKSLLNGYYLVLTGNDTSNKTYYFKQNYILTSAGTDYGEYQLLDPVKISDNGWQEKIIYKKDTGVNLVWRGISGGFMAMLVTWFITALVQASFSKKESDN